MRTDTRGLLEAGTETAKLRGMMPAKRPDGST